MRRLQSSVRSSPGRPKCSASRPSASGVLVTGTSIANLIGVLVARSANLGQTVRADGVGGSGLSPTRSEAAHSCLPRAMEMAGLGSQALRLIPCDGYGPHPSGCTGVPAGAGFRQGRCARSWWWAPPARSISARSTICQPWRTSRAATGYGSMSMGRSAQWQLCRRGYGPCLPGSSGRTRSPSISTNGRRFRTTQAASSCATRRARSRRSAIAPPIFGASSEAWPAGDIWPCDLGPDLSRGFRALKVWMTLSVYGTDRIGAVAEHTCRLAALLAGLVDREPELERLAPVALNIVCFRFVASRRRPGRPEH